MGLNAHAVCYTDVVCVLEEPTSRWKGCSELMYLALTRGFVNVRKCPVEIEHITHYSQEGKLGGKKTTYHKL